MGKCVKCGTQFVGTAASPPSDGLCKYCEIEQLKSENTQLRKDNVSLTVSLQMKSSAEIANHLNLEERNELVQLRKVCDELAEVLQDSPSNYELGDGYFIRHKTEVLTNYSTLPHVIKAKGTTK